MKCYYSDCKKRAKNSGLCGIHEEKPKRRYAKDKTIKTIVSQESIDTQH